MAAGGTVFHGLLLYDGSKVVDFIRSLTVDHMAHEADHHEAGRRHHQNRQEKVTSIQEIELSQKHRIEQEDDHGH